jgi:hypothetical protein
LFSTSLHEKRLKQLIARRGSLRRRIAGLTGIGERELNFVIEGQASWPPEARRLHAEFTRTARDIERLNSRRCARQVCEFKRALDLGGPLLPELRNWWLDRH